MAVLLHPYPQIPGARSVGGGLYYGGLKSAEAMLREQSKEGVEHGLSLNQFKWWFNYMSWGPGQLKSQVYSIYLPLSPSMDACPKRE